ncbi:MAG: hypothetical protein HYZ81_11140 [Nitrospinae bacterium]|nr:hypothetical protein [Nitrospinota bacterium]
MRNVVRHQGQAVDQGCSRNQEVGITDALSLLMKKGKEVGCADAGKTVYTGSSLEIIFPSYTLWEEGLTNDVYPFILTGDFDGTVDMCAAVPVGDQSVGGYAAAGNLVTSRPCAQAGVAGDTTSVAFEVVDLQSPPPHLNAKLTIRHTGMTLNDQVDVPGHRKGKDDHHSAQR